MLLVARATDSTGNLQCNGVTGLVHADAEEEVLVARGFADLARVTH
jgi:hypothetical protein